MRLSSYMTNGEMVLAAIVAVPVGILILLGAYAVCVILNVLMNG